MPSLAQASQLSTAIMLALNIFLTLITASTAAAHLPNILIPLSNGSSNTHLATAELTDHRRTDPFAPTPRPRRLMISIFTPSSCPKTIHVPYMPPTTAAYEDAAVAAIIPIPNGTFERFRLQVCAPSKATTTPDASTSSPSHIKSPPPVLIFSPGLGVPRLLYNAIAQAVAGTGFTVVTVDHPYDASIITYPDGTTAIAYNFTTLANITRDVAVRAKDLSFVLDELSKPSVAATLMPCEYAQAGLNISRVVAFGHSLGGATAAAAMLHDTRIVGGLNFDGGLLGPVVAKGLDRPFVLWGHANITLHDDQSWVRLWRNLRAWKLELQLAESLHLTFSDYPLLVQLFGMENVTEAVEPLLGTLGGARDVEILAAYTAAFARFALGGHEEGILRGNSTRFPEVSVVASGQ